MLSIFEYRIPFKKPFKTAPLNFRHRYGLILQLKANGQTVYSEAAPLPGFSPETLENDKQWLRELGVAHIEEMIFSSETCKWEKEPPPSLCFALDLLHRLYHASCQDKSLFSILFPDKQNSSLIPVNATTGISSEEKTLDQVQSFIKKGFSTIKIKMGEDAEQETTVLQQIRRLYPEITLRIDANRKWTLSDAKTILPKLEPLDIAYIEEPLKPEEQGKLPLLRQQTSIPFAADESVRTIDEMNTLLKQDWPDVFILKPMIIGSINSVLDMIDLALEHDKKMVLTGTLETALGRLATAHLAAGLPPGCNMAHGLATGNLLEKDIIPENEYLTAGCVNIPNKTGLGYEIDFSSISRYLKPIDL